MQQSTELRSHDHAFALSRAFGTVALQAQVAGVHALDHLSAVCVAAGAQDNSVSLDLLVAFGSNNVSADDLVMSLVTNQRNSLVVHAQLNAQLIQLVQEGLTVAHTLALNMMQQGVGAVEGDSVNSFLKLNANLVDQPVDQRTTLFSSDHGQLGIQDVARLIHHFIVAVLSGEVDVQLLGQLGLVTGQDALAQVGNAHQLIFLLVDDQHLLGARRLRLDGGGHAGTAGTNDQHVNFFVKRHRFGNARRTDGQHQHGQH